MSQQEKSKKISRRELLKITGAAGIGLQLGGIAGAGIGTGKDYASYTGWQHLEGGTQFFNRSRYILKGEPYKIVGPTGRPEMVEGIFERSMMFMQQIRRIRSEGSQDGQTLDNQDDMEIPDPEKFEEPLASYYKENPDILELDITRMTSIMPKRMQDERKYRDHYILINAWSDSWSTRESISGPPEVSDFQSGSSMRGRSIRDPLPFKSPALATKLIKKVTHHFGATMVGITKLNPDWCYNYGLRGSEDHGSWEIPKHWEYVIAFGIPHEWDQVMSNPHMGTSYDAYSRTTITARRLTRFIKALGYPARAHSPMDGYDILGIPHLVMAGLGQQGRHGIVITPETGSNFRTAFVTTNLPMEIDKPIDFGVNEFCKDCKICSDICPSKSISDADTNEGLSTRGYRHWRINHTTCYNYWNQSLGPMGCRVCLISCPYSRKDNWVHRLARGMDIKDPTGLVNNGLLALQNRFFDDPDAADLLPPPDGYYATYREAPEWLEVTNYLDIDPVKPTKGE